MIPLVFSIRVPSLNSTDLTVVITLELTVLDLERLQFSNDRQLKVPLFTFLWVKEVKFQI